ncbi:MAG: hypothetical protein R3E64_06165 [Halioglobus sp.]
MSSKGTRNISYQHIRGYDFFIKHAQMNLPNFSCASLVLSDQELTRSHGSISRRSFLAGSLALLAGSQAIAVFAVDGDKGSEDNATPAETALDIAALGTQILNSDPQAAATLEVWARNVAGLKPTESIDWKTADRARERLTERSRVAAELEAEEILFVDGWLLARSEAGAAVLYAAAQKLNNSQSQGQVNQ